MNKYKIIAIFGPAGSGKDTALTLATENNYNLNKIIHSTTRPKRDYEIDGMDYNFISHETFAIKLLSGEMAEVAEFNNWFYGTDYNALRSDCINIGVFSPAAIEMLSHDPTVELTLIYIVASDKTRLLRQLMREANPDVNEIIRRYSADKKDFDEFFIDLKMPYTSISNETESDLEVLTQRIEEVLARIN